MSKSGANAEPSMEEILASIRQIISDEEPAEREEHATAAPEPELESEPDEQISEADLDALFADSGSADSADDAVADDDFAPIAAEPEEEEDDDDVLDLGMVAEPADEAMEEPFDAPEDLDFADPEPVMAEPEPVHAPEPEPLPEPEPVAYTPAPNPAGLLSQESDQVVSAAFANLASTMLSGNARTLEDLVQDMLRPMLKSWLDENLPTMVEKMVREEIERVSRRGPRA